MLSMRRLGSAVALVVVGLGLSAGIASGTSPNPYSTSSGTGTLTTSLTIGTGSCSLSRIAASISNNSGLITGFLASGCSGTLISSTYVLPIHISVDLSTVNPSVVLSVTGLRITNILGGNCLYTGTLTGTGTDGTGNYSVSGSLTVNASRSSGFCSSPMSTTIRGTFSGLRF